MGNASDSLKIHRLFESGGDGDNFSPAEKRMANLKRSRESGDCWNSISLDYSHFYARIGGTETNVPSLDTINKWTSSLGLGRFTSLDGTDEILLKWIINLDQEIALVQPKTDMFSLLPLEILVYIFSYVLFDLDYTHQLVPFLLINKEYGGIFKQEFSRVQWNNLSTVRGVPFLGQKEFNPFKCTWQRNWSLHKDFRSTNGDKMIFPFNISRKRPPPILSETTWSRLEGILECSLKKDKPIIQNWDLRIWKNNFIIIQYPLTRIDSVVVYRIYEKEGGFTVRDIIERILYFYQSPLTEVKVIKHQMLCKYDQSYDPGSLIDQPLQLFLRDHLPTWLMQDINPHLYMARLGYHYKDIPFLYEFFDLPPVDSMFVFGFAQSMEDLQYPKQFIERFLESVDRREIKRGTLIGNKELSSLILAGSKYGYVWTV